jgi:hypothetical protein
VLYTHRNRPISVEILAELRALSFGGAAAYSVLLIGIVLLVTLPRGCSARSGGCPRRVDPAAQRRRGTPGAVCRPRRPLPPRQHAGPEDPEEQRREGLLRAAFAVAAREGLAGVTARAVAAEAGVSSGPRVLPLPHGRRAARRAARVAAGAHVRGRRAAAGRAPRRAGRGADAGRGAPRPRRAAAGAGRRVELFFDYWVRGTARPGRARDHPARARPLPGGVPAARRRRGRRGARGPVRARRRGGGGGLATVAATFVEGCALRVVLDPEGFEVDAAMATLAALVRAPAAVA